MPTPCHSCPKIPAGAEKIAENARELDAKGWRTYSHYLQCRAVGQFPDDELVRRHAAIIRDEEDAHKDGLLIQTIGLIARASR